MQGNQTDTMGYLKAVQPRVAGAPGNIGTERVLALDSISQQVAETNDALIAAIARTRDLADSLLGSPLSDKASGHGGAVPQNGRIDGLVTSTRTTHELTALLREQIERFAAL